MSDPFYDIDPAVYGGRELRRRRTIDHEACHVAAPVALGWNVNGVEIDPSEATGAVEFEPPPGRDAARVNREQLAITVTPRVVLGDEGGQSGSDSSDAWLLAQKVAAGGNGDRWCYVTRGETVHALNAAECDAYRVSETSGFRAVRFVVRELLAELEKIGRFELTAAVQSATEMVVMHRAERRAAQTGALVG
jgi:hypothetical protein